MSEIKNLFMDVWSAVKNAVKRIGKRVGAAACMCVCVNASAQVQGVYPLIGTTGPTNLTWMAPNMTNGYFYAIGGTNGGPLASNMFGVPGGFLSYTTNNNLLTFKVGDYDYMGVTYGFTGTSTSTNDLLVCASYDNGATFQTNFPLLSYTNILPGAVPWFTNQSVDIHGVTDIAILLKNRGSNYITNILFELDFKANKVQTRQATH